MSAPSTGSTTRLQLLSVLGAVVVACAIAHGGALSAGFVYDDHRFVELNPHIQSIDPWAAFSDARTASNEEGIQADIYRPLRTVLFSVEYAMFGSAPFGWHLVSLLLHVLNAVLLWFWLQTFLDGPPWIPLVATLLFVVHPVTSETVVWVSSQGDLLSLAFLLGSLLVLRRRGTRATAVGTLLFLLACLAKESALMLPGLVFLQDLALRHRGREGAPTTRESWIRMGVMAGVIALYFALRLSVLPGLRQTAHPGGHWLGSVRGMLAGLVSYAGMLFWPEGFPFDLRFEVPLRFSHPEVVLGAGLLLTWLLAGLWCLRRGRARMGLALLGMLVALVPVSNVIVPLKIFVAERFLYPLLPLLVLALGLLLARTPKSFWKPIGVAVVALLLVLGVVANKRAVAYEDEMALWQTVLEDRPTNPFAYYGIAFEHAKAGRVQEAYRAFATYMGFNPFDGKAWMQLGDTFRRLALSLRLGDLPPDAQTDIRGRRRQTIMEQIGCYREAHTIWREYGLVRGRGSEAMRRQMLGRWVNGAIQIGDVAEAKFANDELIAMDGIVPSDLEAVWSKAAWGRRAIRFGLAWTVIDTGRRRRSIRTESPEDYNLFIRTRATILKDARLDPHLPDGDKLAANWRAAFNREIAAAERAGVRVDVNSYANLAYDYLGERVRDCKAAEDLLRRAAARHARHPRIEGALKDLATLQAGRMGGCQ